MAFKRNITRRNFLMASVVAIPMSQFILREASAAYVTEIAAPDLNDYTPTFFTADQWAFILAATDLIIPAGGQGKAPGALETNVPIFIDQQLQSDEYGKEIYMEGPFHTDLPKEKGYQIPFYPQQIYQRGLELTEKWCQQTFNQPFAKLTTKQQQDTLQKLESNAVDFSALGEHDLQAKHFFAALLDDTKNGYLSDPMYGGNKGMKAWIAIGFPGARASFTEWVKQHNVEYPLGPVSLLGERA